MPNNAHVTLYGTVIGAPTNRQVNNSTVLSMKVAVQTTKKLENPKNPKYPYASDIFDVAVWGKNAEFLMNSVKDKSRVMVVGDFMMGNPWQDRNGETHINPQVTATSVTVTGGWNTTNNTSSNEEDPF